MKKKHAMSNQTNKQMRIITNKRGEATDETRKREEMRKIDKTTRHDEEQDGETRQRQDEPPHHDLKYQK